MSTLAPRHSSPLEPLTPLDVLLSSSFSSGSVYSSTFVSDSASDSVSAPRAFDVSQSISLWSHHRLDTLSPPIRVVYSHRSRSDRVTIYCTIVFCLFVMDFLISVNSAYFMAPSREE